MTSRNRIRVPVPVRRMGVFALMPLLSIVSSLVLLPTVSATFGTGGWTSVVLGQAIGAAASVICSLQWPTEGPALVAQAPAALRPAILRASIRSRGMVAVACLPLILLVVELAQPAEVLVCFLSALGATLIGLSPSWYYVGIGRPGLLITTEGLPRLGANLAAFALLLAGAPLVSYPIALVAAATTTVLLAWWRSAGGWSAQPERWRNPQGVRALGFATTARTLDAGYGFVVGPIVAVLAPLAYPVFAACDRLAKVIFSGLTVVPQGAAGWISEPSSPAERVRRAKRVSLAAVPLALTVFAVLSVATPTAVHLLFAGTVEVGYDNAVLTGAVVGLTFLGQSLFYTGLAPTGAAASGYRYLVAAFVLGLPSLVAGTLIAGADGALAGMTVSGATLVVLSMWRLFRTPLPLEEPAPPVVQERRVVAVAEDAA